MSFAPSQVGCMPSLAIRPVFPSNDSQLFIKPTLLSGHHLDNQQWNCLVRLYISSLIMFGRGPEKNMESDIVLAYVQTDSTDFVTFDFRSRVFLPPQWITILSKRLHLRLPQGYIMLEFDVLKRISVNHFGSVASRVWGCGYRWLFCKDRIENNTFNGPQFSGGTIVFGGGTQASLRGPCWC